MTRTGRAGVRGLLEQPPSCRTPARPVSAVDWKYEFDKLQWISTHPNATPAEYSAAMLEIARKNGL